MKFILLSRHIDGSSVPDNEVAQNLENMGAWISLLKAEVAMPIRAGKTISATAVRDHAGDLGGLLIFEAGNLEQAIALAKQSPGLKYGFVHEVFPEISIDEAAKVK